MRKKILLCIMTVVLALSCCFALACSDKPTGDGSTGKPAVEKVLQFNEETATVEALASTSLAITAENIIGDITYTSSNEKIAIVDENGKVYGVSEGTATITVKGDKKKDTIKVTVTAFDQDQLALYVNRPEMFIYETEKIDLNWGVTYKGALVREDVANVAISAVMTAGQENATISNKGIVTGINKGTATATVDGTINGIALDEVSLSITIQEKLEFSLSSERETIYIIAGNHDQNKETTFALDYLVKLNNAVKIDTKKEIAEDAADKKIKSIEFAIDDENIVTYDEATRVITKKAVGETTITFTATTEKDTVKTATITVIVDKPVYETSDGTEKVKLAKNKENQVTFALPTEFEGADITKVSFNGIELNSELCTVDGNEITVKSDALNNSYDTDSNAFAVDHVITVNAEDAVEKFIINYDTTVYDMAIADTNDFETFLNAVANQEEIVARNVILTADIDASKLDVVMQTRFAVEVKDGVTSYAVNGEGDKYTGNGSGSFRGILDGDGHTIYNGKVQNGIFWSLNYATIKNIAFVGVSQSGGQGAMLTWSTGGNSVFDNIYLQGTVIGGAQNGTEYRAGLSNGVAGCSLSNIVIDVEFVGDGAGKGHIFSAHASHAASSCSNLIGISDTNADFSNSGSKVTGTHFATAKAYRDAADTIKAPFVETGMWDVTDGVLMFTSAKAYLKTVNKLDIDQTNFFEDESKTFIAKGASYTLSANLDATYALAENDAGATLEENVLTIPNTAESFETFKLNAVAYGPFVGNEVTTSISFNVAAAQDVNVADVMTFGKNRNSNLTIKVADGLTSSAKVVSAIYAGAKIENANIEGDSLVISSANMKSFYKSAFEAIVRDGDTFYRVNAQVENYDFLINSNTEWVAFATAAKAISDKTVVYVALDGSFKATATSNQFNGGSYGIYLDGKGFAIDNVACRNGMFPKASDLTVKNIAFTNLFSTQASGNAGFGTWGTTGAFENVYYHGVLNNAAGSNGVLSHNISGIKVNNAVFDIDVPGGGVLVHHTKDTNNVPKSISNVFVYSENAEGVVLVANDKVTAGSTLYKDIATYNAAAADIVATLGAGWEVVNGMPIMSSAKAYLPVLAGVSTTAAGFKADNDFFTAYAGEYTLNTTWTAGSASSVTYALAEAIDGVTLENGVLTIANTVADATAIVINVSAIDAIYGNTLTYSIEVRVKVIVDVPYTANKIVTGLNRTNAIVVDVTAQNIDSIESVSFNGQVIKDAITVADSKLSINPSKLAMADSEIVVVMYSGNNAYKIVIPARVADFAIGNETEFAAWFDAVKANPYTSVAGTASINAVLTDNVDLKNTYVREVSDVSKSGALKGYFDGQGYTIANFTVGGEWSPFSTSAGFTFKNVAFVNLVTNASDNGYLFRQTNSTITFDNVYLDMTAMQAFGSSWNGICNLGYQLNIYNSVMKFKYGKYAFEVFKSNSPTNCVDSIVIADQAKFSGEHTTVDDAAAATTCSCAGGGHVCENVKWYKTQAEANAQANANLAMFDTNIWCVNDGVLMFKSTRDGNYYAKTTTVSATATGFEKDNDVYTAFPGEYTLNADYVGATFALAEAVDGVSLTNGVLTIADSVAAATEITINISAVDVMYGSAINGAIKVRVKEITKIAYTGAKQVTGLNRTTAIAINDTASYAIDAVSSATFNDTDVSKAVTVADSKLSIDPSKLVSADSDLIVVMRSGTEAYKITIPVRAEHFAIANETEFAAWYNKILTVTYVKNATEVVNVVLTGNVTLTGTYDNTVKAVGGLSSWKGTMDGQGYTISNFNGTSAAGSEGVITNCDGVTLKNVGFVNFTVATRNMFAGQYSELVLDNVYFDFISTKSTSSLRHGLTGNSEKNTIKNSVVKFTLAKTAYPAWRVGKEGLVPTFDNAITIANQTYFSGYNTAATCTADVPTGAIWYKTQDAANAAILADNTIVSKFDTNYWTLDTATGELYWTTSRTTNA